MGSLYRSQHELLPLFEKGSAPHVNKVDLSTRGRWRSNAYTYPRASSLGSDARRGLQNHPTVKPVATARPTIQPTSRSETTSSSSGIEGSRHCRARASAVFYRVFHREGQAAISPRALRQVNARPAFGAYWRATTLAPHRERRPADALTQSSWRRSAVVLCAGREASRRVAAPDHSRLDHSRDRARVRS